MTQGLNQSMNDEGVCRTAPAKPGLLITTHRKKVNVMTIRYAEIIDFMHLLPFAKSTQYQPAKPIKKCIFFSFGINTVYALSLLFVMLIVNSQIIWNTVTHCTVHENCN